MFEQVKTYYTTLVPGITEDDWNALEEKLTIQHLSKGDFLVRNGEVCRYVTFINKGLLRLFYLVDGREISTGFVAEENYISEYTSFLTRTPAALNIDALEDAELVQLSYEDMQKIYITHPVFEQFGRKIAELLFNMLSSQNTRLLTLPPEERYRHLIEHESFIIQRVPQYMIASFIGISPEHLSRIRRKKSYEL